MEEIERLRRREEEALDLFVTRHHAEVFRFLHGLTRHRQEAEDLAQRTFLRALDRIDTYSGAGTLRSWLLGIAYRKFTRWRRRRLLLPILADRPAPGDPFRDFAEAEVLRAEIGRLPEPFRAAFLLHHVAEVALALAIPEGTVKSRLHAARARLRQTLGEEDGVPRVPPEESCGQNLCSDALPGHGLRARSIPSPVAPSILSGESHDEP